MIAASVGMAACSASVDAPEPSTETQTQDNTSGAPHDHTASSTAETTGATIGDPAPAPTAPAEPTQPTQPPTTPAPPAPVTADALLAKLASCTTKASTAPYAKDSGGSSTIDICKLTGAVFFKADMDIDCDGKSSAVCNKTADAAYQSQTAAVDSKGNALDAATLPYIVVPGVSSRWSYKNAGITMGTVGAVIYNGKIEYGIIGDIGPTSIVGEASYAMAKSLGINANPSIGGVDSGVTYVIFTGAGSKVSKNEDHAEAAAIGAARAQQLLDEN